MVSAFAFFSCVLAFLRENAGICRCVEGGGFFLAVWNSGIAIAPEHASERPECSSCGVVALIYSELSRTGAFREKCFPLLYLLLSTPFPFPLLAFLRNGCRFRKSVNYPDPKGIGAC